MARIAWKQEYLKLKKDSEKREMDLTFKVKELENDLESYKDALEGRKKAQNLNRQIIESLEERLKRKGLVKHAILRRVASLTKQSYPFFGGVSKLKKELKQLVKDYTNAN